MGRQKKHSLRLSYSPPRYVYLKYYNPSVSKATYYRTIRNSKLCLGGRHEACIILLYYSPSPPLPRRARPVWRHGRGLCKMRTTQLSFSSPCVLQPVKGRYPEAFSSPPPSQRGGGRGHRCLVKRCSNTCLRVHPYVSENECHLFARKEINID
jgi:hypothetical protein